MTIAASPKPTIGMMNGLAYGGAAVLASSLDMRIGCEGTKFRFLAAAYGRINSTWSLGCQIGWPMAKELLFSARIVEAEEAYRIGLLNHLVPRAQLRAKTMELAKMIAGNHRGAVMGVKALLLQQKGESQEAQWAAEHEYTTKVMRGAKARDAFPEFLARKGISGGLRFGAVTGGGPRGGLPVVNGLLTRSVTNIPSLRHGAGCERACGCALRSCRPRRRTADDL